MTITSLELYNDADMSEILMNAGVTVEMSPAPLTPAKRKDIAEHLYAAGWTMDRIGEKLGVSKKQISRDLSNCDIMSQLPRTEKRGRPKRRTPVEKEEKAAALFLDGGKTVSQAAAEAETSVQVVKTSVAREEGRREVYAELEAVRRELAAKDAAIAARDATIAAKDDDLKDMREKFDTTVAAKLVEAIAAKVADINDLARQYTAGLADVRIVMAKAGIMRREMYLKIASCLHPDSRMNVSNDKLNEVFVAFTALENVLVIPEPKPVAAGKLDFSPGRRRQVQEERKAKRAAKKNAPTVARLKAEGCVGSA